MRIKAMVLGLGLLVAGLARAAVPSEFTVQGVLRDGQGKLQTQAVNVIVTLHDAQTDGNLLAGPYTANNVPVTNGLFTVTIPDPALSTKLAGATAVWMEVSAGNDTFPRQKVTPNIYALLSSRADTASKADTATKADSATNADTVTNGVYTTGSYANPTFIASLDGAKITNKVNAAKVADSANALSCSGCVTNAMLGSPIDGAKVSKVDSATTADTAGSATTAGTATNFSGALAGDVTGTQGATSVKRIQGVAVATTAPTNGQILSYNGTQWTPVTKVPSATAADTATTATSATTATTATNFSGALAGDVTGTQGATAVKRIQGVAVAATTPASGEVLSYDGTQWAPTMPAAAPPQPAATSGFATYSHRQDSNNVVAKIASITPPAANGVLLAFAHYAISVKNNSTGCQVNTQLATSAGAPNQATPGFNRYSYPNTINTIDSSSTAYSEWEGSNSATFPVTSTSPVTVYLRGSSNCADFLWNNVAMSVVWLPAALSGTFSAP